MRETISSYSTQYGDTHFASQLQIGSMEAMEEIRERMMLEAMDTRSPRNQRLASGKKTLDRKDKKKPAASGHLKRLIRDPHAYLADSKNSCLSVMRHLFPKKTRG
jgi:hypothetical protein